MTWNFSVPWNLSMYLYCCLSGILHYSKNVLCLLKAWDGRNPAGGQRTALSVAMSKEERHHWLLVSYPSFNVHLFLSSRCSSLREGDVEESRKILKIFLQPYARDSFWEGKRPWLVNTVEINENTLQKGIMNASISWQPSGKHSNLNLDNTICPSNQMTKQKRVLLLLYRNALAMSFTLPVRKERVKK